MCPFLVHCLVDKLTSSLLAECNRRAHVTRAFPKIKVVKIFANKPEMVFFSFFFLAGGGERGNGEVQSS